MKEAIISKEDAQQIAVDIVKKRKSTERFEVSTVEQRKETWIVRGTCPIDLEGHPWAERFEVTLDARGRVKSAQFALL